MRGEKCWLFFLCEIHFLKIGKIHIWLNFFKSSCLKFFKLEPFWGKNPLWCQSGYSCLSRPGLGSTDWDHSLWWLHFSPPAKQANDSAKQEVLAGSKKEKKKQEFLWDVVNIVLNTMSAFLDNYSCNKVFRSHRVEMATMALLPVPSACWAQHFLPGPAQLRKPCFFFLSLPLRVNRSQAQFQCSVRGSLSLSPCRLETSWLGPSGCVIPCSRRMLTWLTITASFCTFILLRALKRFISL